MDIQAFTFLVVNQSVSYTIESGFMQMGWVPIGYTTHIEVNGSKTLVIPSYKPRQYTYA